ncbi:hypothetical protein [Lacipirellula sp.]|uniref:hypothetical protein n=1 Tax=Lacipirellula sp. TaxID=2691419 RepID=UPI003D0EB8D6
MNAGFLKPSKPTKPAKPALGPRYLPTPDEIREQCEKLQAGWSDMERRYRYLTARTIDGISSVLDAPYAFPSVDQSQLCVDFSCG